MKRPDFAEHEAQRPGSERWREMPVWGAVFLEENRAEHYPAYTSLLHSRALTDHLRSIQE